MCAQWPPTKSQVGWSTENLNTYDSGTNIIATSGPLNISSTTTLAYISMQGFNGNSSWMSVTVLAKTSGGTDTYQLQASYDKTNWFNVDNPLQITQALVGTPSAGKAWNKGQLAGYPYYQVLVTLDVATANTTAQWGYDLVPGGF